MAEEKKPLDLNSIPPFAPLEQVNTGDGENPEPGADKGINQPKVANSEDGEDDKPRVPYSRFQKLLERDREREREAAELRERLAEMEETLQSSRASTLNTSGDDVPDEWIQLLGDTPEAKKVWSLFSKTRPSLSAEEIRQEAIRAYQEQQEIEGQQFKQNLNTIDSQLEDLEVVVGRPLTEEEQAAVLDIADDYTPKDADGNYIAPLFSLDRAWEVYELKNQATQASSKKSRDRVASLTGSQSRGQPAPIDVEKDKSFDPRNMDAWRNNPLLNS